MSFLDNVKDFYESPSDSLGKDFIKPALNECILYRRETAWFKASALRVWAGSLVNVTQNPDCKIEIIAYPQIDESTYRALKDSLSEDELRNKIKDNWEKNILLRAMETDAIADKHNRETGKKFGELLSYLIKSGKLEIKFAQMVNNDQVVPTIIPDDFEGELTHNKRGYFKFTDDTVITFTGSANESLGGLMKQGESFEVYDSRKETDRANSLKQRIDATWNQEKPGYVVEPVSKKVLDRIKKFAPNKPPVFSPPTPAPTPAPTEKPEDTVETPDWVWEHKKEAIKAFLEHKKGILQMATGTGKTSTALEIARQLILRGEISKIIVSPGVNTQLSEQWVYEVYDWLEDSNLRDMTYVFQHFDKKRESMEFLDSNPNKKAIIIASRTKDILSFLLRESDPETTLIIQDEVHGFGAQGLLELKDMHKRFKFTLGLSATPSRGYDEEGTKFIKDEIGDVIYEYTLENAIKDKILCPFNYYPIKTELSFEDNQKYKNLRGAYEASQKTSKRMSEKELAMQLARIKNNAENKPYDLDVFLSKKPELVKNSIVFCAEWSQAEKVCEVLFKYTKNFKRFKDQPTKDDQRQAINSLGKNLDCIVTCHALSEGIDIKTLKNIFLIASYASQLETIQRIGRCIRVDPEDDSKVANVVDLIVYRNIEKEDIIKSDRERRDWIQLISEVRPDG